MVCGCWASIWRDWIDHRDLLEEIMKKTSWRSSLLLFLAAFIWGTAFVAQSVGMDYIEPFTFSCVRSIVGSLFLIPCICFLDRIKGEGSTNRQRTKNREEEAKKKKVLLQGGVCCGLILFVASNLQQFGIKYTSVGKAGFITALYIVLVPILGIFIGKKIGLRMWISVFLAVVGLYLLCITGGFSIGKGDFFVLLCACVFSFHILAVDYFSPKTDGVRMSCIQFLVCGVLSGIGMLIKEKPDIGAILQAWMPILYAGVLSSGVAYTLQIISQKDLDPTVASLIMCLESVVSVLAGWVLLGQKLSTRELLGCGLMFAAIILAQLPAKGDMQKEI